VNKLKPAFTEVYDIINHMEPELKDKIPKKFVNLLKQNRDNDYETNIDYTKSITEQELLKDTKVILGLIYRDFLCSKEKRKELIEQDKKSLIEYEKSLREKYNPDNLFIKKNNT